MKFRLLVVLLALSLIFNVFFLIGALRHPPRRSPMAELTRVANQLRLDDRQAERFGELRQDFREEVGILSEELHQVRQAIRETLASDAVDSELLDELMATESTLIAKRRQLATGHFGRFVDLLTPEQRSELGTQLHGGRSEGHRDPPHIVDRFDTDGDGTLNEAERHEAHKHMEERRTRHEHRRDELRKKFDANSNGRLEPEEREAMRAWLLEQGFAPPDAPEGARRRPPGSGPPGNGPPGGGPRGGPGPRGGGHGPHGGGPGPHGGPPPGGGSAGPPPRPSPL